MRHKETGFLVRGWARVRGHPALGG